MQHHIRCRLSRKHFHFAHTISTITFQLGDIKHVWKYHVPKILFIFVNINQNISSNVKIAKFILAYCFVFSTIFNEARDLYLEITFSKYTWSWIWNAGSISSNILRLYCYLIFCISPGDSGTTRWKVHISGTNTLYILIGLHFKCSNSCS